ncbi:MAG: transglycosylase domain-containing protein [Acutalibacteraceae bacterium]|jgi:penicillin-binding protein 1A|nr:transglycosylase domain-containing protein [Acutalibacteraceae bacterium]
MASSNTKKTQGKSTQKPKVSTYIWFGILLIVLFFVVYCIAFVHGKPAADLDDYRNNQAQTTIIYAKNEQGKDVPVEYLHGEQNRIWVSLDKIPKSLQDSFRCLEDKRFYDHHGVDWIRTIAAVVKYHGHQGGSTLTQQLIKNLTGRNQITIHRKFREILCALNLENNYSKDVILEAYLNTIPLGSGCYGVRTAADTYFGKDVSQLDVAESACLASITQAPTYYNPLLHPLNNEERRKVCLQDMLEDKAITESQYYQALGEKLIYTNSPEYVPSAAALKRNKVNRKVNSWFVDYVIDNVASDLMDKYNYTRSAAVAKVYSGGLRIYTTENIAMQNAAEYIYENRISFPSEPGRTEDGAFGSRKKVQSACTIMDYEGHVVAMVGGAGPKTLNRSFNRATDAVRSPGSSIKPLSVYAPAMEKKLITYSTALTNYALQTGGRQWPRNFDGGYGAPNARVTTQYAVAQSLNTTSARVAQKLTPKYSLNFLEDKFHFDTLVDEGHMTDANLSSMAVGGMTHGVTTLEMCAAYAAFGNGGKYYRPHCYTKVTNSKGDKVLLNDNSEHSEQALSRGTADVMNKILQTVVTEGTGAGCGVSGFQTFMKTGTTSDTKDKWACGGSPYYVGAFWFGYDSQEEITYASTGYNPAAHIFSAVMSRGHRGLPSKQFDYGNELHQARYCTYTGELAGSGCPSATGWFARGNMPERCDGVHRGPGINNVEVGATEATEEEGLSEDASDISEDMSESVTYGSYTYRSGSGEGEGSTAPSAAGSPE